jgi:1-pyrroline-5-carboxylate dehydrogenase
MNDEKGLPRVTYTGSVDLDPLHDWLDRHLPAFRAERLGRRSPNLIGGRSDDAGPMVDCMSPLDGSVRLASYPAADAATVARAVQAARAGFDAWSALSWKDRLARMKALARALDDARHELAMAVIWEVGKTRGEALGEAEEAVALIEYYADQLEKHQGFVEKPWKSTDGREQAQVMLRPHGVFGVISPFNYPVALAVNMLSAALAAGNAVVWKPTPNGALVAGLLADVFLRAGLPEGTFNLVQGPDAGPLLVDAVGIDGIAITGSHRAGMDILRKFAAGAYMRPVLAELGGKNHAFVDRSADITLAVEGVARSAFGMQGQRCTACSVALVHESIYDEFAERLVERAGKVRFGDTTRREITNGPLINEAAFRRFEEAAAHARASGRVRIGGRRATGLDLERGFFVEPTVVDALRDGDRLFEQELFAPLVVLDRFADLKTAIARGARTNFGLTAGYYGSDRSDIESFLDSAQAGVLYVNRQTGATNGAWPGIQSFSGWKGSGVTGKGALGPHYLPQFMREQCRTVREI